MVELCKFDSTQMEFVDSIGCKPLFVSRTTYSIQPAIEARRKLASSYPEYEKTTSEEKRYIQNIAMNSNIPLRRLAEKYIPNTFSQSTKSVNNEAYAVRWIRAASRSELISDVNGCTDLVTGANSMWSLYGMTLYAYDSYFNAMYDAVSLSIRHQAEYGGFSWQDDDNSGVLIQDPFATIKSMHIVNFESQPFPTYDFHVHPSGILSPSEEDYGSWSVFPLREHHILDFEGNDIIWMW